MELVVPPSENDIAQSYRLFHVVMQAPVSLVYSQEKKWEVPRLTMHGAYKWDKLLPWLEDPQNILVFLDYHFGLATRSGQNQDGRIQKDLPAVPYVSGPPVPLKFSSASIRPSPPLLAASVMRI